MPSAEWDHPFTKLLDDDFKLWCAGDDPPSASDVAALEGRLGCALPEQYCKFLRRYGGVMLEVEEHAWPRAKEFVVGPFWSFQYAYLVFGTGKGIPEWLDIEAATAELHRDHPASVPLVPFFRHVASTTFYRCFDDKGRIYDWSREEPAERRRLEESFDEIIIQGTRALAENKEKIKCKDPRY